jgi:hypothetical protein
VARYKYRDVLASVICFYYFSRVLSPARLQMWLKKWNILDATDVELVYVNDGRIIHRSFNLNEDKEHITLLSHPNMDDMVDIRDNDISLNNYEVI